MPDRDIPLIRAADIATALALLTRLPGLSADPDRNAPAAWAYPLAGLAVGAIAVLTGLLAQALGLPPAAAAGLILVAATCTTGAMHEDGLADTADGLWGGWDKTRRLEIMKDSHIGTYGTLALILSVGLRWSALTALIHGGLLAAPVLAAAVLSRAPMVALMHALPRARSEGLSHHVGRPSRSTLYAALGLALGLGLILLQWQIVAAVLAATLTTLAISAIARAKIGGQTGDLLGATQQIAEIAILLTLAATLQT